MYLKFYYLNNIVVLLFKKTLKSWVSRMSENEGRIERAAVFNE